MAASLPDDAERVIVLDHIYGACDVAAAMTSPEFGALEDFAAAIRDEVGGNPRILTALAALDASRKARQRLDWWHKQTPQALEKAHQAFRERASSCATW